MDPLLHPVLTFPTRSLDLAVFPPSLPAHLEQLLLVHPPLLPPRFLLQTLLKTILLLLTMILLAKLKTPRRLSLMNKILLEYLPLLRPPRLTRQLLDLATKLTTTAVITAPTATTAKLKMAAITTTPVAVMPSTTTLPIRYRNPRAAPVSRDLRILCPQTKALGARRPPERRLLERRPL